jgi:hypothetical protein
MKNTSQKVDTMLKGSKSSPIRLNTLVSEQLDTYPILPFLGPIVF